MFFFVFLVSIRQYVNFFGAFFFVTHVTLDWIIRYLSILKLPKDHFSRGMRKKMEHFQIL